METKEKEYRYPQICQGQSPAFEEEAAVGHEMVSTLKSSSSIPINERWDISTIRLDERVLFSYSSKQVIFVSSQ
ncbi:MAG: hypothetical protein AB8I69_07405 [Anaerolineae bacterium]|jgi:hypothetical protein